MKIKLYEYKFAGENHFSSNIRMKNSGSREIEVEIPEDVPVNRRYWWLDLLHGKIYSHDKGDLVYVVELRKGEVIVDNDKLNYAFRKASGISECEFMSPYSGWGSTFLSLCRALGLRDGLDK